MSSELLSRIEAARADGGSSRAPPTTSMPGFPPACCPAGRSPRRRALRSRRHCELNDRFYRYSSLAPVACAAARSAPSRPAPRPARPPNRHTRASGRGQQPAQRVHHHPRDDRSIATPRSGCTTPAVRTAQARHRARRPPLLAPLLRTGCVHVVASRRHRVHLRGPALHAAAQLQRAPPRRALRRGHHCQHNPPTTTASRPTSRTAARWSSARQGHHRGGQRRALADTARISRSTFPAWSCFRRRPTRPTTAPRERRHRPERFLEVETEGRLHADPRRGRVATIPMLERFA